MGNLEEENLRPKTWQMSGEISARDRPENALLEEHLSHEHGTRPGVYSVYIISRALCNKVISPLIFILNF